MFHSSYGSCPWDMENHVLFHLQIAFSFLHYHQNQSTLSKARNIFTFS